MSFTKAVKSKARLRMAVTGTSGSGKTYTALSVAQGLGSKIALIDSEYESASKYADKFDFDTMDISSNTHPNNYSKAIDEAVKAGYEVLIIDSLTHAWDATKKEVDKLTQASKSGNSYIQWQQGTKIWDSLKATINKAPLHIIVTMRSKAEYVQEEGHNGKKQVRKIGLAPEVRDGTEYEFDVVLDMNNEHFGSISKTRCSDLDGYACEKPSKELGETLKAWLSDGIDPAIKQKQEDDNKRLVFIGEVKKIDHYAEILDQLDIEDLDSVNPEDRSPVYKTVKFISDLMKLGDYLQILGGLGYESAQLVPFEKRLEIYNKVKEALK